MSIAVTSDKRTRLIEAAAKTVYTQGYSRTTLADIAREAEVPLGNVYYYFKTKEALGAALVEQRARAYAAARDVWERSPDPRDRITSCIRMTLETRNELARRGCPVGTLCSELQKEGGALGEQAARIFSELIVWLEAQFRALGKGEDSRSLALHILVVLEGAAVMAHSLNDPEVVVRETRRLADWVRAL